jgi:hypothetical protein
LAARPEESLRDITFFLGENVEDTMLEVLATSDLQAGTPSTPAVANQAVERSVVDRLGTLGYLRTNTIAQPSGRRFHVIDWSAHRTGMEAWAIVGSRALTRRIR